MTTPGSAPHRKVMLLIPSRNRPQQAMEAAWSAVQNAALPSTVVRVLADGHHFGSDTGRLYGEAWDAQNTLHPQFGLRVTVVYQAEHLGLVGTLNAATSPVLLSPDLYVDHGVCRQRTCGKVTHVGFMGDDHRVRSRGWDWVLSEAAGDWGMAYGNDGIQGENLPTAVLMAADIVRVLGRMAPPCLYHMYIDDYWRALGLGLGHLTYLPNLEIEHLHHSVGKSPVDATYNQTNNAEQYARDLAAWNIYRQHGVADEVEKIAYYRDRQERELRQAHVVHERAVADLGGDSRLSGQGVFMWPEGGDR